MVEVSQRTGNAISGRLLADAVHRDGRTLLDNLYHSVPFHVSKPYWNGSVLLLQVANPTAGLFSGDQLSSRVQVEDNAALLFTNQGASRIHPRTGAEAVLDQSFYVFENGWLEIYPELIIPHRGASLIQKTIVDVEIGGRAYLSEMLAPGRTASGETYGYEKLDWRFRLNYGGNPLVIERAEITSETIPWMFARPPHWQHIYYGCVWIVAPEISTLTDGNFKELEDFPDDERLVGVSRISPEAITVKVVAASSIPLRRALQSIRSRMSDLLPFLNTNPRKL
jgi:urease accessory protein